MFTGEIFRSLGLVLSTKIFISEKFSEKDRKFLNLSFLSERSENYIADVLAWLAF
jgi:hypothetical protein